MHLNFFVTGTTAGFKPSYFVHMSTKQSFVFKIVNKGTTEDTFAFYFVTLRMHSFEGQRGNGDKNS